MVLFLNIVIHKTGINCGKENAKTDYEDIISEKDNEDESIETNTSQNEEEVNWYIEIPSINLKAPICESTNMDVLSSYVGHFIDTPKAEGNIGLAGHNRGYEKNYFQEIYKLKKGEEIKYKHNEFEKIYLIEKIEEAMKHPGFKKKLKQYLLQKTKLSYINFLRPLLNPFTKFCAHSDPKSATSL